MYNNKIEHRIMDIMDIKQTKHEWNSIKFPMYILDKENKSIICKVKGYFYNSVLNLVSDSFNNFGLIISKNASDDIIKFETDDFIKIFSAKIPVKSYKNNVNHIIIENLKINCDFSFSLGKNFGEYNCCCDILWGGSDCNEPIINVIMNEDI